MISDSTLHTTEVVTFTLLASFTALALVVRRLSVGRRDFSFARPVAMAFVLRIGAAALVSLTNVAGTLRGGDETVFLYQARVLSHESLLSSNALTIMTKEFYVWVFSLQQRLLASPEFALRITQVAFSVAGVAFLLAAVYELGGRRAAFYAQFFIILEPGAAFFSSLIHKEALMYLAEGLVAYGCALVWRHGRIRYVTPVVIGCLLATATRPYAGWFIALAAGITLMHASRLPGRRNTREAKVLAVIMVVVGVAFTPLILSASSHQNLANLQNSQMSNSIGGSNLALEQVNFSTRTGIITNLPIRIFDVVLRPYPWQLGDVSQKVGLAGSLATLLTLALLIPALWRSRGRIFTRAGPLVYLGFFTLCGYALSTGNAGTGFRYRTHFLLLGIALTCVLRTAQSEKVIGPELEPVLDAAPERLVLAR